MAVTIKWKDNSIIELGHRIYRSNNYFTKDNLPAPLADIGPNVEEYEDPDSNPGENWYIVSSYIAEFEAFSKPFLGGLSSAFNHDIFNDDSAIATYPFNGNTNELSNTYNGTRTGSGGYVNGLLEQAIELKGNDRAALPDNLIPEKSSFSVSFWFKVDSVSNRRWIAYFRYTTKLIVEVNNGSFRIWNDDWSSTFENVNSDTWYHVVVVYNHDITEFEFFLNAQSVHTNTKEVQRENKVNFIGGGQNNEYDMNGYVDQLRIFNKAITQEEVDILYIEGVGLQ